MAQGSAKLFRDYPLEAGKGDYNNTTDTFKIALLTDQYSTVSVDGTNPVLGNFTEVTPGGNYSAGGITLTGTSWSRTAGVTSFTHSPASLLKNASNPTGARTALIYNVTATSSAILAFDLTTDGTTAVDLVNNDLNITANASGVFTGTVA